MKNKQVGVMTIVLALVCSGLSFNLLAQQGKTEYLSEVWVMTPKAGKADDLEKAIKSHMEQRKKLGDPRKWNVYRPVLGDNLDVYMIRACCFEWKDQDAYMAWNMEKEPIKHWDKRGDKHVASYAHHMSVIDSDNSNWPEGTEYNYVGVTTWEVKMGHGQAVDADKKMFSDIAKKNNWPYKWSWFWSVGGSPTLGVASPYKTYAEMAPPEVSFGEMLSKHLDSEEEAAKVFERWASHFKSTSYSIYRHDKELSMD